MNGESIEIIAPSKEQAQQLGSAIEREFDVEVTSNDEHSVRVTPNSETAALLVSLFNAVGEWLTACALTSCDIRFGERSITVLPASAEKLGDPTEFLIERTRQLEQALASRIVIEQAKGVLAERRGVAVDEAFELLRREARSSRRRIRELAAEIVTGEADLG